MPSKTSCDKGSCSPPKPALLERPLLNASQVAGLRGLAAIGQVREPCQRPAPTAEARPVDIGSDIRRRATPSRSPPALHVPDTSRSGAPGPLSSWVPRTRTPWSPSVS